MELDTHYIHLAIENKILIGTYKNLVKIDLDAARHIVQERIRFAANRKMPAMIISGRLVSMDKPARDYLASAQGTEGLLACAIIVTSPFARLLGIYFMSVNKPPIPVKIFRDTSKAEQWLQQYIPEH